MTMTTRRYGDDEVREIFSLATTGDTRDRPLPAESGGLALAAFGANLIRLPRWARERKRQMQAIAEHAVKLLSRPSVDPPPTLEPRR